MWIPSNKKKNLRKLGKRKSKINGTRTREFRIRFQKGKIKRKVSNKKLKNGKGKSKKNL